jgi:hypothetical protein
MILCLVIGPITHSRIGNKWTKINGMLFWPGNATVDTDEKTPLLLQVSGLILECQNACPTVWRQMAERGGQMEIQLSTECPRFRFQSRHLLFQVVFVVSPILCRQKLAHPIPTQSSYNIGVTFLKKSRSHFRTLSARRVMINLHTVDPKLCSTLWTSQLSRGFCSVHVNWYTFLHVT